MKLTRKEAFRLLEEFYCSKKPSYICTRLIEKITPSNELVKSAENYFMDSDSDDNDCMTEFTSNHINIEKVFYSKSPKCVEFTNEIIELLL